ncbi:MULTISPECIES: AraC family transcriptional regulator [unclassified Rhizobium]|uniref:helix-turn-helix domain-containing protein n=1 Tax=unclassified Rhizobium TaxID=2613769 RepID=UPI000EA99FDF|nr:MULTISPECIES: AraC family transcriptional regulator [unclassified Rhizobium]AYG69830.1 AraC family transcriptional regulator [Rhizobium sp. CCGE531]AYG76205.1 AraC family transcriptional regulator [Rhizobium sp. CCGE532]
MLFIPFPFAVAIVLLVLFAMVFKRGDERPANVPFLALILVSAFQSALSGLRWGYGIQAVMYVTPLVAATMPPLVYAGVFQLVRKSARPPFLRIGIHILPAILVLISMIVWRDAIDVILVLTFIGYAIAILRLMRPGMDALRLAAFDEARPAYYAILFAAASLLLSAALDTVVAFDLIWMHGRYAPTLIVGGNLVALIILSAAAAAASRSGAAREAPEIAEVPKADAGDIETMAAVQALMSDKRLYEDHDLTLNRLARKAGLSARQISEAINRATGKNVSQYVNEFRIAAACKLLTETEKSVIEIMYAVGFQTKSNFNREFRRVTDVTPLEWRKKTLAAA